MKEDFRSNHARTDSEIRVADELFEQFNQSGTPGFARLQAFPAFVRRQDISRFLVRHDLFLKQLKVAGVIVECGVYAGGSAFSWAHFSSIYEPWNHTRQVFGFDTFSGFPDVSSKDFESPNSYDSVSVESGLFVSDSILSELNHLASLHDQNRPIGHIPKVNFVRGDVLETLPRFVEENPYLPISLLYLDMDLYEPTKVALEILAPRVVSGGLIVFDELVHAGFPGESLAAFEYLGFGAFERNPLDPHISWIVKK
jgi:hypothetical protein